MPSVANIYDSGPISPIAKIGENLAIWRDMAWYAYKIQWYEGIPRSSPFVIDLVAASAATNVAAGATTTKTILTALACYPNELLHLRWEPIDDIEGMMWELSNQARYATKGAQARVSKFTRKQDPNLSSTTFWIFDQNRDPSFSAFNPWSIAQSTARVAFWGYRYILQPMTGVDPTKIVSTFLPAQGR